MTTPLIGVLASAAPSHAMQAQAVLEKLLVDKGSLVLVVFGVVAVVAIVFGAVTSMVRSSARERSRREIAAYIAEGSMTAEQGEKLMSAKDPDD